MGVSDGESKVQYYKEQYWKKKKKEQYCTRTWKVRFMNQGNLDTVKQEVVRVNIDILESVN